MGCSTSEVCLYTQPNLASGSLALSTGSLWCANETGTNGRMSLTQFGLQNDVRSVDSENAFWAEGIWSSWIFMGKQWELTPYSLVANASPNNIWYVDICRYEKDFIY